MRNMRVAGRPEMPQKPHYTNTPTTISMSTATLYSTTKPTARATLPSCSLVLSTFGNWIFCQEGRSEDWYWASCVLTSFISKEREIHRRQTWLLAGCVCWLSVFRWSPGGAQWRQEWRELATSTSWNPSWGVPRPLKTRTTCSAIRSPYTRSEYRLVFKKHWTTPGTYTTPHHLWHSFRVIKQLLVTLPKFLL